MEVKGALITQEPCPSLESYYSRRRVKTSYEQGCYFSGFKFENSKSKQISELETRSLQIDAFDAFV